MQKLQLNGLWTTVINFENLLVYQSAMLTFLLLWWKGDEKIALFVMCNLFFLVGWLTLYLRVISQFYLVISNSFLKEGCFKAGCGGCTWETWVFERCGTGMSLSQMDLHAYNLIGLLYVLMLLLVKGFSLISLILVCPTPLEDISTACIIVSLVVLPTTKLDYSFAWFELLYRQFWWPLPLLKLEKSEILNLNISFCEHSPHPCDGRIRERLMVVEVCLPDSLTLMM